MKLRHLLGPIAACVLSAADHLSAQTIDNFSPTLGQVGQQVVINGSGFVPGNTRVYFNGRQSPTTNIVATTQMYAIVPSGATTGRVGVRIGNGATNLSFQDFIVIGPGPYVTNFSPNAGSGSGQFSIYGVQFQGNVTSVRVGGTNVFGFRIGPAINEILVTNRADVVTGLITVSGPNGSFTTTNYFYVVPILITNFVPTNGPAGTVVEITGKNFLGTTNVQFNGVNALFVPPTNNTKIYAIVPNGTASGKIRVTTPGGVQESATIFRVTPTITGFSPSRGAPGTSVTVFGANLNERPSVQFNGANATITATNFSQLTVTVPGNATTGPIRVTTTNGTVVTTTNFFLPPRITGFTPSNSPQGTLIMTGSNFLEASAVSFNGVPASFNPPTTNTTFETFVPLGFNTTGPISVTTPFGATNSLPLLDYAPPTINSFSPPSGLPGTNVTILGVNFLGTSKVLFNGTNAAFTNIDNGKIIAIVPTNAQTGPITVIAPAGTNTTIIDFVLNYTSDLVLTLTDAPDPVFVTNNLIYTLNIVNNGPFAAPNVKLTNTLPASVVLKSASTTQGTLATNGNPIIGTISNMNVGGNVTVTFTVIPQATGTITNLAAVAGGYPDPTPTNAIRSAVTTVLPTPVVFIKLTNDNQVRVSWPGPLTNFGLQFRTDLDSAGGSWSAVGAQPQVIGDENVVIETNLLLMQFYRLRQLP